MRQVPPYHPRRGPLGERVRVSASLLEADPATASFLAGELTGLRASALGRWLRPGAPSPSKPTVSRLSPAQISPAQISLSAVVRERAVAFFPLDQSRHGRPAQMIANLVALDLAAVFAESQRLSMGGDGLAWFGDGAAIAAPALAQLIATGSEAGLATVVSTVVGSTVVSPVVGRAGPAPAAGQIAALANVVMIRGPGDPGLADLPVEGALASDEFALLVRGPERQVVPRGRFVPGRLP
jgi:hypothetical protein